MKQGEADTQNTSGTVSLGDEEAVKQIVVDAVFSLWDVVSNLTRLRPTQHERYRVTIFGSARAQPGSYVYEEVKRLAEALAAMGCDIITGGGPGLMQAANAGAEAAGDQQRNRSVGIRVHLPFEQDVNPFVSQAYEHKTFFSRLHHFVLTSDAYVVVPGGIGTVLELMMVWQLLQVQHVQNTPLILVGKMWQDLVYWARDHLTTSEPPLAHPADIEIPQCVFTADEALELLAKHHAAWSLRREDRSAAHTSSSGPEPV